MKEDKITRNLVQSAHDVLSGNVKSFHQQAQEEYFEMYRVIREVLSSRRKRRLLGQ